MCAWCRILISRSVKFCFDDRVSDLAKRRRGVRLKRDFFILYFILFAKLVIFFPLIFSFFPSFFLMYTDTIMVVIIGVVV